VSAAPEVCLRRATMRDVEPMMDLINGLAADGLMLPRSPASIVEKIRDFIVATVDGEFAGCGALAIIWTDIAEVRSIAVAPRFQKLGLGRRLAQFLIDEAEELEVARVMAFTYVTGFFEKLGFAVVEHESLPHKVFTDCLKCPKFHKCDEVAVVKELGAPRSDGLPAVALPKPGMPLRVGR